MTAFKKLIILWLMVALPAGCQRQAPQYRVIVADGNQIKIGLAAVNDGGVHFFTYKLGRKNINFFVRRDGGGRLRTHFDACYSCFKYKLGYVREKNQVVCIACRIGYDLDEAIWDYVGACAPINLSSRIAGDHLIIKRSLLEKGEKFF